MTTIPHCLERLGMKKVTLKQAQEENNVYTWIQYLKQEEELDD